MPVLAEAAVEITADTNDFGPELESQIEQAGDDADRAARGLGTRIGSSITGSALRPLRRITPGIQNQLSRLQSRMSRLNRLNPFAPAARSARALSNGFRNLDHLGSRLEGGFYRIGRSLNSVTEGFSRLRGAVTEFGNRSRSVFSRVQSGVSGIAGAFGDVVRRTGNAMEGMAERTRKPLLLIQVLVLGVAAALATLPAAATIAGTAIAAGFGAGIAGIGIAAATQSERVQETFVDLRDHVLETLEDIASPFEDTLISIADTARDVFDDLTPALEDAFADAAPAVERFASTVLGAFNSDAFAPVISTATRVFTDLLEDFGPQLAERIENLADTLVTLFNSTDTEFLAGFLSGVIDFADALLRGVAWLSRAREEISEGLEPAMRALSPLLEGFAAGWDAAWSGIRRALGVLEPVGDALTAMFNALEGQGDTLRLLGTLIGGATAGLVAYRTAALLGAAASQVLALGFRGLTAAIGSVPIVGWVLVAISALVALYQTSENFRDVVNTAFVTVRDAVVDAWDVIEPVWNDMVAVLGDLWDAVSGWEGWVVAWDGIQAAVVGAWEAIQVAWDGIVAGEEQVSSLGDASWWQATWGAISTAASAAWSVLQTVWDGMTAAAEVAANIIGPALDRIGQAWGLFTDLLSGQADLGDVFGYLVDLGGDIAGVLIDQLQKLPGLALEALGALAGTIVDFFAGLPGRVSELVGAEGGLLEWMQDLPGRALNFLTGVGQSIADWFLALPQMVRDNIDVAAVMDWMRQLPGRATSFLARVGTRIVGWFKNLPQLIRDNIDPGAIIDWLKDVPGRVISFMQDYGPQILKGFAIAIAVVVAGIPALLAGLAAAIFVVLGTIGAELSMWALDAFTSMMTTAGQAVADGISSVVGWFAALPGRVLGVVSALGSRLASWGRNAIQTLLGALRNRMNRLEAWWDNTWTDITDFAQNIFRGLVGWLGDQAATLRDTVMGPVDTLRDRMVDAFRSARTGIGRAWRGLKSTVAGPIEWVVNTGYNDWIRGVWGKVTDKFGGPDLPSYTVNFAKGGVFPGYTPGRDVHAAPMAAFSGGESVLRPEITRAWGAKTTLMLNKLARAGGVKAVRRALAMLFGGQNPFTGGGAGAPTKSMKSAGPGGLVQAFDKGGILGRVSGGASRAAEWLNSKANDFGEGMLDFLDDPGGMLRKMLSQVFDYTQMPGWGSSWTKVLRGVPKEIIDALVEQAKELFAIGGDWMNLGGSVGGRLGAALGFAKAQRGKPYTWGGVGPGGYDCSGLIGAIHNVILGKRPYSRRYTTHGFRGSSYGGFRRNMPSPFTVGVTNAGVGHMAGTLLKTNVESRGSAGVVVGSRARGTTSSLFNSRWGLTGTGSKKREPMGGEGILYDSGGMLMPGLTLVNNASRKPETVRSYAQEGRVERLVKLVESQTRALGSSPVVPADRRGELAEALGADIGGTTINAPVNVTTYAADPETVAYKTAARIARLAGVN